MNTDASVSKDKLVEDFRTLAADGKELLRTVIDEAEELLKVTASQAGEKAAAARDSALLKRNSKTACPSTSDNSWGRGCQWRVRRYANHR